MSISTAALVASLLAAPALAQTTWTVDDDGPADFAQIDSAVLAASDGDRVLVQPGTYAAFFLDKGLTVLGAPGAARPQVASMTVHGAPRFDVAHLALGFAEVVGVPGASRLDDCTIAGNGYLSALRIVDVGSLLVQGSDIAAATESPDGYNGARVEGSSVVAFVGCSIAGGDATASDALQFAGYGGGGLYARDACKVMLAGTSVRGGAGEDWTDGSGFDAGKGGGGVGALFGAFIDVRGSSSDVIRGGPADASQPTLGIAAALSEPLGGMIEYGGVTTMGAVVIATPEVIPPAPHLSFSGGAVPGSVQTLSFFGEAGAVGVVALSLIPVLVDLPGIDGTLWIDVGGAPLLPFVLQGADSAATLSAALPPDPGLAGLVVLAQGVELDPGGIEATNPAAVVLSF